jgi:hypothetical protein
MFYFIFIPVLFTIAQYYSLYSDYINNNDWILDLLHDANCFETLVINVPLGKSENWSIQSG